MTPKDANPLKFPLDKLTTLQGVEWLRMIATVPIDDVSGRILCCKFDSCPRGKSKRSPSDGSQDMLSNGASSGGCGNEESSNLGGAADRLSGEWIVLDMVEDDGKFFYATQSYSHSFCRHSIFRSSPHSPSIVFSEFTVRIPPHAFEHAFSHAHVYGIHTTPSSTSGDADILSWF